MCNRFEAFIDDNDSDDENDVDTDATIDGTHVNIKTYTKHK